MKLPEEIGKRIVAERKRQGLRQTQLARRMGISQGSLSEIEAGKRNMKVTTIAAIALALGVDCSALLPSR